nr:uncharacterized protein LOC128691613 isoform X2 [Cherax quadricarinatus]
MYKLRAVYCVFLVTLVDCLHLRDDPFCTPFTYTCDIVDGQLSVECVTTEILENTPWMASVTSPSSKTVVAISPTRALLFGGDYKYSWMDNGTEREIPCNRWDACIDTRDNGSLYVEYHWSDPSLVLDLYGYTSERPISMKLTGQVFLNDGDPYPIPLSTTYNFALFDDSPNWENLRWAFEIPSNVYCPGLPDLKAPPSRLADAYSMRVEVTAQISLEEKQEWVSIVKNWYDYDRQLTRADYIPSVDSQEYAVAGLVEVAVIQDFHSGVEYIVDKSLGNCTTIPIPNNYDTITDPSGHVTIKDPLKLFGLGHVTNLTYYGTKYARQLPCDVWMGRLDFNIDNGTLHNFLLYEIYFLQSGWREDGGEADSSQYPQPILIKIQEDITSTHYSEVVDIIYLEENVFKFEAMRPSLTVYDITSCFSGHDHIRRFEVAFPGDFREDYDSDSVGFTDTVQENLAQDLGISPIRVQHVLMEFDEHSSWLYCQFTLVDQPQVDGMTFPSSVGPPLDQVVTTLQNSMDHLIIVLYNPSYTTPGHIKIMEAYNNSLHELFDDNCTPMLSPSPHRLQLPDDNKPQLNSIPSLHTAHKNRTAINNEKTSQTHAESMILVTVDIEFVNLPGANLQQAAYLEGHVKNKSQAEYTPGDMAGMGIGMFFLGLVLGVVVMMATLSKFGLTDGLEFIAMNSRRS